MQGWRLWRLLSSFAMVWLMSHPLALSAEVARVPSPQPVQDVVLHERLGEKSQVLVGTVLDERGQPCGESEVKLLRGDKLLATTRCNKDGFFAFCNVSPGVYRVVTANSETHCRVWPAVTAPPGALPGMVAFEGDQTVRGQILPTGRGRIWRALRNPWVIGGIVAVAVAVPVAIALADDDDEAPPAPATP